MAQRKRIHTYLVAFTDKDGNQVAKHVKSKSSRQSKVKKQIEGLFKIKISECKEFNYVEVNYPVHDTNK